jgi:hypothetical protein
VQSRNLRIDALMLYGSDAGQLTGPKPLEVTQAMNDGLNAETASFQLAIAVNEVLKREAKHVYLIVRYSLADGNAPPRLNTVPGPGDHPSRRLTEPSQNPAEKH